MDDFSRLTGDARVRLDARPLVSRRGFLSASAAALVAGGGGPAMAQLTVDITGGVVQPVPIAISPFAASGGQATQLSTQLADVVAADLQSSGLFEVIDRRAYIQSPEELRGIPRFADWRQINAQALVTGVVNQTPTGLAVEYRLWDVLGGTQMHAMQLAGAANIWRRFSHKIADGVYQRITGDSGYFDSKIVYVSETGPKAKRNYRLAVMDQDGANHRFITDGRDTVLGPRFSRDARRVAYLAYKGVRLRATPAGHARDELGPAVLPRRADRAHHGERRRQLQHRGCEPADPRTASSHDRQRHLDLAVVLAGRIADRLQQ
jgi:TolB protein